MEGPTPVSALIHAATLVTAGVFLILRLSYFFEFAPKILNILTLLGAITAFFAATVAITQFDIKKIIAYSTCSQLGYMILACGLSQYDVAFFHLVNHAFFKSLLFLGAGAVIHALAGEQDIRRMGGLSILLPFSFIAILTGSLSLSGFPFLTGYYSKDVIILATMLSGNYVIRIAFVLSVITAFLTAFYSFRLLYYVFLTTPKYTIKTITKIQENDMLINIPLVVLSICSIFLGYFFMDSFINYGTDFWQNSIYLREKNYLFLHFEFLPYFLKFIPLIVSITGLFLAFIYFEKINKSPDFIMFFSNLMFEKNIKKIFFFNIFFEIYHLLINKWFFDIIYNAISKQILFFGYHISYKIIDNGILFLLQPNLAKRFISKML